MWCRYTDREQSGLWRRIGWECTLRTRHRLRPASVMLTGLIVASLVTAGPAGAAPVTLGGGSGIVVDGDTFCTLTAIGTDNRGELIGFTSAHCGGPGAKVAAEGVDGGATVGEMVAGNDELDYAVIKFDPAAVTPTNNVDGFVIDGLGPDPHFGDIACKLGRTTGYSCGVTWGPGKDPGTIVNQVCGQPGDSGAPVTVDNKLVGMLHGAFTEDLPTCVIKYIPLHTPAVTMSINTQLADIVAKNRPGSGFRPFGS